jgi:hypothetical protein
MKMICMRGILKLRRTYVARSMLMQSGPTLLWRAGAAAAAASAAAAAAAAAATAAATADAADAAATAAATADAADAAAKPLTVSPVPLKLLVISVCRRTASAKNQQSLGVGRCFSRVFSIRSTGKLLSESTGVHVCVLFFTGY